MKDFGGADIKIGDTVAIVYHPRAYKFVIKAAAVEKNVGTKRMLVTRVLNSDEVAKYMPDKTGESYPKLVKISSDFPPVTEDTPVDAVGHAIHLGDRIACMKPIEGGGNTLKGFEKGGTVVKLSDYYVFYADTETGETKRKGYNGVVVCFE